VCSKPGAIEEVKIIVTIQLDYQKTYRQLITLAFGAGVPGIKNQILDNTLNSYK
jgi:hypothetical protein